MTETSSLTKQESSMRYRILVLICVSLLTTAPLYAEVMDKEPTITVNWLYALLGGAIALLSWRYRWWLGLGFSVIWLSGVWFIHEEISDPSVGAAILREAGQRYVTHFYSSASVALAIQATAVYLGWRSHRARKTSSPLG